MVNNKIKMGLKNLKKYHNLTSFKKLIEIAKDPNIDHDRLIELVKESNIDWNTTDENGNTLLLF